MGQKSVIIDQIAGTAVFKPDAKEAHFQTRDDFTSQKSETCIVMSSHRSPVFFLLIEPKIP